MKKNFLILLILLCTNLSAFATPDKIDMTKWQYNSVENVFYQLGIPYCDNPVNEIYEKIAVFVPAQYLTCTSNDDNTYSCTINKNSKVKNYTPKTAPIVMPVDTPGYSSNPALDEYKSVWEYTNEGFIYIYAGCRGKEYGAPAGVTDLKAAVRYIKFNKNVIPGDINKIFSFGMSGGGAQSIILGVSGNNKLFKPYLKEIGAVDKTNDSIFGSMAWCPITNLDTANEAYEWNLGASRKNVDKDLQKISDKMAISYVDYVNDAKFRREDGTLLELRETNNGIYQGGSYYNYLEKVVNQSFTNFLADNLFPIDMKKYGKEQLNIIFEENQPENIEKKENTEPKEEQKKVIQKNKSDKIAQKEIQIEFETSKEELTDKEEIIQRDNLIFNSGEEYVAYLNSEKKWIDYDPATYSAKISNLNDFVTIMKSADKPVGAFDGLERQQNENILFNNGNGKGLHFDNRTKTILDNTKYAKDFEEDFVKTDYAGNTVETRMNMYNPLYYIMPYYKGYKTSKVAKYFRIRTGLSQTDTALTTEVNLALALKKYCGNKNVDFETVWAMGHVKAERRGTPEANFVRWVNKCSTKSKK